MARGLGVNGFGMWYMDAGPVLFYIRERFSLGHKRRTKNEIIVNLRNLEC